MLPEVALNSISSNLRIILAAAIVMTRERWFMLARGGYMLLWTARPVFDVAIAALIHVSGRPELVSYAVVGITANAFIFATLFWVGEILDRERMRGTLPMLFLAPSARISWLTGYSLAGAFETLISACVVLVAGVVLFDVSLDVAPLSLLVTGALFLTSLAGFGLLFSAAGLWLKRSNALSNLISPLVLLLGGIYFPVSELPLALRIIARTLPLGYATEALALSMLEARPLHDLAHLIVPLSGFALITPVLGYLAIRSVDGLVRQQGTLDLY